VVVFAGLVVLGSCNFRTNHDAKEALKVAEEYLSAIKSGDIDRARSYWTDFNDPGGTWTMVARRDMEHVTLEHGAVFASGFEIVKFEFQAVKDLKHPIGVLKLDVRVQPGGQGKKLETGLVRHKERWYIYSIYPGAW